jgi:hypothetical protein
VRALAGRAALREDAACLLGELGRAAPEVALSVGASGLPGTVPGPGEPSVARYIYVVVSAGTRATGVRLTHRWLVLKPPPWWSPSIWPRLPRRLREVMASAGGDGPGRPARAPSPDE